MLVVNLLHACSIVRELKCKRTSAELCGRMHTETL